MVSHAIALVVSRFNSDLTEKMEAVARNEAKKQGLDIYATVHVFGTFDTPLAAHRLLKQPGVRGVAVLGSVLKGETDHDVVVVETAAHALTRLSLEHGKPVSLGIVGPRVTREQAEERAEKYARNAVRALKQSLYEEHVDPEKR